MVITIAFLWFPKEKVKQGGLAHCWELITKILVQIKTVRWPYSLICFICETRLLQLKKNLPKPYYSTVHVLFHIIPCIKNGYVFSFSTKLHVILKNMCGSISEVWSIYVFFFPSNERKFYFQLFSIAIQCNTGSNKIFPFYLSCSCAQKIRCQICAQFRDWKLISVLLFI